MACKKGQPGNPCCPTEGCLDCVGDYTILGVTIDGTWATPGYGDDSSGCPVPIVPGTFLLETELPKADPIQVGIPVQCERKQTYYGDRCDNLYYDAYDYSASSGYFTKKHKTIWAREWCEVRIHLIVKQISGINKVILNFENWWMVDFLVKDCTYTTTSTYGSLDDAKTAELNYQCLPFDDPVAWSEGDPYDETNGWTLCSTHAVRRTSRWEVEIDPESCSPVCEDLGTPTFSGERYVDGDCPALFVHQSPWFVLKNTVWYEKNPDGSTPGFGNYQTELATVWERPFDGDETGVIHGGALTGTIREQIFCSVPGNVDLNYVTGGGNFVQTATNKLLREPIWPIAPTAVLLCE